MTRELLYPSLVTILSLLMYMVFTGFVGRARSRYNVPAPQTSGNDNFERVLRVQQNTAEQMLSFLPALWIFALVLSPIWAAALGGVWIVGRIVYAAGYFKAAAKRGTGFAITSAANVTLILGSLIGIILALTRGT
jgi:glutathione S-transferase